MQYEVIIEILQEIFGDFKSHNDDSGQISFDCPVCSFDIKELDHGDGKGNLEINYKLDVFKCWACSESHETHGSVYKLVKKYGNEKHLKNYLLYKPESEYTNNKVYNKIELPEDYINLSEVSQFFKYTNHYKEAINYLYKRNINDKMIRKFNIGFCFQGDYKNRIIIPSYNSKCELNYFVARSYSKYAKLKYKNPEVQKEILIFNEYFIDWSKPVYIVEGVFDSIFVENSIAMLGKHLSSYLHEQLYAKAKEIIIILDGDAWNDAQKLYHKLNCGRLMNRVSIVRLPLDKDLADLKGDISDFLIKKLD